jgi:hypothetical protein
MTEQDSTQQTTEDQQQEQDTEQTTEQVQTERQDTFDREYVEKLRAEAAAHRTKLRKLEEAEEKRKKEALSETERLKAEKEEAEKAATESLTKANQRSIRAEARVQALEAGTNPQYVAGLLKLSDLSDVEVDDDGEPDAKAVKKAIEASLKEYPMFKGGATVGGSGGNPANGGGNDPEKNPWADEHLNVTQQGVIYRADPQKAHRLAKAAGKKL